MRRKPVPGGVRGGLPPISLPERLAALDEVLEHGQGRYDQRLLAEVAALRSKADERLARGEQIVVVALAGGTGSGKSSLFNTLAGETLATVGVRRPVTTTARGLAVGDAAPAERLLDWLDVPYRHHLDEGSQLPDGLVLIDLPDMDSVEVTHRDVVDRFVERVDVLVWVVDPLKYAQRSLHAGYLRQLTAHAEVLMVVLNRADELEPAQRRELVSDLRRILADEGLAGAPVFLTSATTGLGIDDLRKRLSGIVRGRRAAAERIAADVRTLAGRVAAATGPSRRVKLDAAPVTAALSAAVGVEALADTAARDDRDTARAATRPLLFRPIARLAGKPARVLRGFRRVRPAAAAVSPRRSLPSPVAVRHALLTLADRLAADLPGPWAQRVRSVAADTAADLPQAVASALDAVPLAARRRLWWPLMALVWSLVELCAAVGVAWLVALGVVAWLQLPPLPTPTPMVTPVLPWPTALALGGGLVWLVVGWVRNRLVAVGAARHRRATLRRLRAVVSETATTRALPPLAGELAAHDALADAVHRAAA